MATPFPCPLVIRHTAETRSPATTHKQGKASSAAPPSLTTNPTRVQSLFPGQRRAPPRQPPVIARRAPRSLTHLNHWCVLARETDLPAWRQSDGVIGRFGLTMFTVHPPSPSVMVSSTRYVLTDDTRSLAQPRPRVSPAAREGHVRVTRGRKKRKESCARLFTDIYPRPDELSASETVFSRSCKTRCSVSADQFRACDERARNRWIDQPFTAGNATFSRDIPRRSTVTTGIE